MDEPALTPSPSPASPKKNNTWIAVVIALAVVLVLCVVLVVGAAVFAVYRGYIAIPGVSMRSIPGMPMPIVPNRGPNPGSGGTKGPLTVQPYQPTSSSQPYPALQDLATNWVNPTGPGTNTYAVSVPSSQPVLLATGWCTSTQTILDQNFQHIQYLFTVDGKSLSSNDLFQGTQQANGQVCKDYIGLIQSWPVGNHTINITMRVDAKINDGMNDYAAGDYTEVYNITVPQ